MVVFANGYHSKQRNFNLLRATYAPAFDGKRQLNPKMSLLFKNFRIHQVFGANTDVGKTILTSALIRASAAKSNNVYYLKPVSTGPMEDADDAHVKKYAGGRKDLVHTQCLYRFKEPVSPHLAAALSLSAGNSGSENVAPSIPSDETFVNAIANHIRTCVSRSSKPASMYVETAGGVHSPLLSGNTQVDGYRPLFLPTILIGDSKLGGISSTISSYESLVLRGYIVDSILLFRDEYYRNWEYLKSFFAERGVRVTAVSPPPPRNPNPSEDYLSTEEYYKEMVSSEQEDGIFDTIAHLDSCHSRRLQELDSMPRRTLDTVWWPFVQHGLVKGEKDVMTIDSAWSDFFSVHVPNGIPTGNTLHTGSHSLLEPKFDGSASWWTQTIGHAHPALTIAAARAAGRYGHVMFPQATHLPALKLAERLIHHGPGKGWAARAFISDDGSTGMEVALKMALRAFSIRNNINLSDRKHLGILGLKGSYHGDTIGAMDACEEGVYTCEWHNAKGYWFEPPTISFKQGKVVVTLPPAIASELDSSLVLDDLSLSYAYDMPKRLNTPLAHLYTSYIRRTLENLQRNGKPRLAALVLEPLVMGAGGMIFVDPLFQRAMIDVIRTSSSSTPSSQWSGMPVIFDEVFVGLYRLGLQSTAPLLGVNPDISVNAKILTGGLVPLAVTMASDSIFQAFNSSSKADALLHGHSYTAHPIGCEVANETLNIIESLATGDSWLAAKRQWKASNTDPEPSTVWSFWDPDFVKTLSSIDVVSEVMTLGTVLALKINDKDGGYVSTSAQTMLASISNCLDDGSVSTAPGGAPYGIHFRTLGNVAYFMTSLNTPSTTIRSVEDKIWRALQNSSSLQL